MGRKNLDRIRIYQEVLKAGRHIDLNLEGRSMFPFIMPGDKAKVRWVPLARTRIGEVVVFRGGQGKLVSHRIIFKKGDKVITKGDFSPCWDRKWKSEDYLGKLEELKGKRNLLFQLSQAFYPLPILWSISVSLLSFWLHPFFRLYLTMRERRK